MSLPISFLSDFGLADEFVGVVHGVIATLAPGSRVIDVNHNVAPGDVRGGALSLMRAIQYLPEGVALAVVDPGVGTDRRAIAIQTEWGYFVGPDNGLLSPAVAMVGGALGAVSIENADARLPATGATFHGRDVFAPAAALLAAGETGVDELGPRLDTEQLIPMLLPLPEFQAGAVKGTTWWIDHFGNVQTNLSPADLATIDLVEGGEVALRLGAERYDVPWVGAYGDAPAGTLVLVTDSHGLVAISAVGGSAADRLGIGHDREVVFSPSSQLKVYPT